MKVIPVLVHTNLKFWKFEILFDNAACKCWCSAKGSLQFRGSHITWLVERCNRIPREEWYFPRSWISFSLSRFVGRWQLCLHSPSTWIHCGWNMMLTRQCSGEFTSQDIEKGGVDDFILNWIRKRKAIQAVSEKRDINSRQSFRTNQKEINLMSIEQKLGVAMMIGIELWTCKRIQYALYFLMIDTRHKEKGFS